MAETKEKKTTAKKAVAAKSTTAKKATTSKAETKALDTKKKAAEKKIVDKEKKLTAEAKKAAKATPKVKTTTVKTTTVKTVKVTVETKPKATTKATAKPSKAELKAQEAKKKVALKKTTTAVNARKAKAAKEETEAKAKVEREAQAALAEVKAQAEASKRRLSKIQTSKSELASLAELSKTKKEEEHLTKVIILHFDNKALPKSIFASPKIYEQAIFDTIMADRAAQRQGTHDVKSRAEVSGGGKKPWRQKGTGRARSGSNRSPIWVGGGRAFGPTPERNYILKVNKKVRKAAFISALTLLSNKKSVVIDDFKMSKISTKEAFKKLTSLKIENLKHILIVTTDEVVYKSVQNLPNVICVKPNSTSVENLLWADALVLSNEGLKNFEGRYN